ncbi:uncharacterized protein LOC126737713 isoform X2 [Anthonomus grandis grandis]|uniref:uncharacterized protein LOC126737713 isoform X2 n=1 Tax=Anthonomus grandis grandis TaxID=2921223 RepID=UPI002164F3E6|nr:uncharacterized protein LOC126737713 isoform X2 [Anthonomus grandis grandis]
MKHLTGTRSLERNSRLSLALVKNRAEQNNLSTELNFLDRQKTTALRVLKNDKQAFRVKYARSGTYAEHSDEPLSKYFVPSSELEHDPTAASDGDRNNISAAYEEIHNMLFTNNEIDKEKILCLHLISAHRTESLTPPKRKFAYFNLCKVHSPLERLLERSKRKNIHHEQKMTNMLPIYTVEMTELGSGESKDLINDGRLATRILLNERVRELINTVLNALKQSNPEKNYELFEMANDVVALKQLFTKRKILDFLDDLLNCPLINNCDSFILTAPFRVKSVQLEIRTVTGSLELLIKQIRQNVLQPPPRAKVKSAEDLITEKKTNSKVFTAKMSKKGSEEDVFKALEGLYTEKQSRRSSDNSEKKIGRRGDTNFVRRNIDEAANAKKVEYDKGSIADRPHLQPIKIPEEVTAIMIEKDDGLKEPTNNETSELEKVQLKVSSLEKVKSSEHLKIHLKQTTCPACMERYKIPLPAPKTPRVKPSSVIPLNPGENPHLKTNSRIRISMLINKEMFKLQSYERRFSSEEGSRRSSMKKQELETCSSSYITLTPLELAKIEQEIKEKETQKKLEKFLSR